MKITLIGYGKMGHMIEEVALSRGHSVILTIDSGQEDKFEDTRFTQSDVAIEFTTPDTAEQNIRHCFDRHVPVVCGTTGTWTQGMNRWQQLCREENQTLFWASNFSVGMNIFFALNRCLAELMGHQSDYVPSITEIHHIHKLDSPSGTAVTLAEEALPLLPEYSDWTLCQSEKEIPAHRLGITAIRRGEVPGTHSVRYISDVDSICMTHEAFSRRGFALGAVLAAEYTRQHSGFLTMRDLLAL